MKNFFKKNSTVLAALAIAVTTLTANLTCVFYAHQSKMPEGAKKLRKF